MDEGRRLYPFSVFQHDSSLFKGENSHLRFGTLFFVCVMWKVYYNLPFSAGEGKNPAAKASGYRVRRQRSPSTSPWLLPPLVVDHSCSDAVLPNPMEKTYKSPGQHLPCSESPLVLRSVFPPYPNSSLDFVWSPISWCPLLHMPGYLAHNPSRDPHLHLPSCCRSVGILDICYYYGGLVTATA